MGFIIETPLSPHMAGRTTRLIARDFFLLDTASRALRCKARRQSPSLVSWNKHGHLEQARTDLCPAGSVKVSHLDQTRSDLCPASSVSVRCVVVLFPRAKVPPPGTELDTSNKHGSICALPAQSKSVTSNKREPICAQLALSRLTTSNKLDTSAPCQSGQCDCLVQSNKLYCSP